VLIECSCAEAVSTLSAKPRSKFRFLKSIAADVRGKSRFKFRISKSIVADGCGLKKANSVLTVSPIHPFVMGDTARYLLDRILGPDCE
jgi:hypothetical protein